MTKSTKYQTIEEILEFAKSVTKGDHIDAKQKKEFLDQANFKITDDKGNNILHRANAISDTDPQIYHLLREALQIKGIDLDRQNNNAGFNPTLHRRSLVASFREIAPNKFFHELVLNSPSPSPQNSKFDYLVGGDRAL